MPELPDRLTLILFLSGVTLLILPLNMPLLTFLLFLLYNLEPSSDACCELFLLILLDPFLLPCLLIILVVISDSFSTSIGLLLHGNTSKMYLSRPFSNVLESS